MYIYKCMKCPEPCFLYVVGGDIPPRACPFRYAEFDKSDWKEMV